MRTIIPERLTFSYLIGNTEQKLIWCHSVSNNQPAILTTLYDQRSVVSLIGRYRDEDH